MSGSDPNSASQGTGRGGFWSFWGTLPGVLTGSAALLTAIVGLMTLLKGSAVDQGARGVDPEPPSSGTPAIERPAPAPDSSTADVFAEGQITMRSPDSVDLEAGLVGTSPPGYDLYLHCSGIECILNAMRSLITVANGPGDKASCIEALRARRDGALYLREFRAGQLFCLQTEEGHVGQLEILQLPGVGSIDFVFTYTLWR